ncbi:MAG: ABC transporter substrate-binding protein, partial [Myxococcota bacterium]
AAHGPRTRDMKMMKYSWRITLAALLTCTALVGCDDKKETLERGASAKAEEATSKDAKATAADVGAAAKPESEREEDGERLITLGGGVTEIVFAVGKGDAVVAVDTSSTYPTERVEKLPKVGYVRKLDAEGILSMNPTRVITTKDAGPAVVIEQIKGAGIEVSIVPGESTIEGAKERITAIGALLDAKEPAARVIETLERDLDRVQDHRARVTEAPKALFIYARGPNVLMVSGAKTAADEMIRLAGAENAVTGFEQFKPLTAEAVVAAAPDVLVMPAHGAESIGGVEGVVALPGVAETPAGKARRLVTVDDLALLGFGPRMGEALLELQKQMNLTDGADDDARVH